MFKAAQSVSAALDSVAESMRAKAEMPSAQVWIMAMLGGAYIALAGFGSTVASCNLLSTPEGYGLGRFVAGLLFPIGLMMIVVGGGELFTGNCMMTEGVRRGSVSPLGLLRNWALVYGGNFAGGLVVVWLLYASGQFMTGGGHVAEAVIKTACAKMKLGGTEAFLLGILCNWLVCLAVWMAARAETMAHKAFVLFFPVCLFVVSGYEHSVANMYYLSAGMLAGHNAEILAASGLPQASASVLTAAAFAKNMFFVTLGNIVGGGGFVIGAYALGCKMGKHG